MHEIGLGQTIIEESGLNLEVFSSLEKDRLKLVEETVVSLVDIVMDGKVLDVYRISKRIGVDQQLISYIKAKIWDKGEWGESTIHLGAGYNLAEILLMNGDEDVFKVLCRKENQLANDLGLKKSSVVELFAAYANSGKENEVVAYLSTKENKDSEYWQAFLNHLDAASCPNLVKLAFQSIDKKDLKLTGRISTNNLLLKDQSTFSDCFDLLKSERTKIEGGESNVDRAVIIGIMTDSINTENMYEIWAFIQEILQTEMGHDDYLQCFLVINRLVQVMEENQKFKEQFFSWMLSDNWQKDEIKRYAFTRVYMLRKNSNLDGDFEKGFETWVKSAVFCASPDRIEAWVNITAQFGFKNSFVQKIFDLFEKDKGVFEEQWNQHLPQYFKILIGQGMFSEVETIIRRKTSHTKFDRFVGDVYGNLANNGMEYDSLNIDAVVGKKPFVYDDFWSLPKPKKLQEKLDIYFSKLKEVVAQKPRYLRRMISVGINNLGLLNKRLLDIFSAKNMTTDMDKSGSALHVMTGKNLGIIVNEVPIEALRIWESISATDVPVAPLLKVGDRFVGREILTHNVVLEHRDLQRAYSRFCGLSVAEYLMNHHNRETLLEIQSEMDKIKDQVSEQGFSHGHPHLQNFTVEFWNREFLEAEKNRGVGINQVVPKNVDDLTFDPEKAESDPSKWIRIIRLIDWDSPSKLHE